MEEKKIVMWNEYGRSVQILTAENMCNLCYSDTRAKIKTGFPLSREWQESETRRREKIVLWGYDNDHKGFLGEDK